MTTRTSLITFAAFVGAFIALSALSLMAPIPGLKSMGDRAGDLSQFVFFLVLVSGAVSLVIRVLSGKSVR